MYPQGELAEVARTKTALRQLIACRRRQCVTAAAVVLGPLGWLDRAVMFWRSVGPLVRLVAWPVGAVATRSLFRGPRFLGPLLRWAPAVLGAVRALRQFRAPQPFSPPASP